MSTRKALPALLAAAALSVPASAQAANKTLEGATPQARVFINHDTNRLVGYATGQHAYTLGNSATTALWDMNHALVAVVRYTGSPARVQIESVDLANRTRIHTCTNAVTNHRPWEFVSDVEMRANGSLVWISGGGPTVGNGDTAEVHILDNSGLQMVDSSPNIDLNSLALSGQRAYWTDNGVAQVASIL